MGITREGKVSQRTIDSLRGGISGRATYVPKEGSHCCDLEFTSYGRQKEIESKVQEMVGQKYCFSGSFIPEIFKHSGGINFVLDEVIEKKYFFEAVGKIKSGHSDFINGVGYFINGQVVFYVEPQRGFEFSSGIYVPLDDVKLMNKSKINLERLSTEENRDYLFQVSLFKNI